MIEDLDRNSENKVIDICAEKFKQLIVMKPYRNNDRVRVLTCTIDEE